MLMEQWRHVGTGIDTVNTLALITPVTLTSRSNYTFYCTPLLHAIPLNRVYWYFSVGDELQIFGEVGEETQLECDTRNFRVCSTGYLYRTHVHIHNTHTCTHRHTHIRIHTYTCTHIT